MQRKSTPTPCARCGTLFSRLNIHPTQRYCSKLCANRSQKRPPAKPIEPKACVECGKVFTPFRSATMTCSRSCTNRYRAGSIEDRFWAKVDKRGPDECWDWRASRASDGYGHFWTGERNERAHRFSYELNVGPVPELLEVRHTCHRPPCVNPSHLIPGTHLDNMHDREAAGRTGVQLKGEKDSLAKLKDVDVAVIRKRYAAGGIFQKDLAGEYGVHVDTINRVITRRGRFKPAT